MIEKTIKAGDLVKKFEEIRGELHRAVLVVDIGAGGSSLDNMAKAVQLLVDVGYRPIGFSAFQAAGGFTQAFCLLYKE